MKFDPTTKLFMMDGKPVEPQPKVTVLAGTGHRKIGKNEQTITADGVIYNGIRSYLIDLLIALSPREVISGMAIGYDLALADAACQARIPFVAAIPYRGHGEMFGKANRSKHDTLVGFASRVVHTSEDYRNAGVYVVRDRWMVDNSEFLFAFYDGRGVGGTKLTMDYAESKGKVVVNLWDHKPDWEKV